MLASLQAKKTASSFLHAYTVQKLEPQANPKQTIECGENRVSDFAHGFGCIAVRERRLAADNHQRLPTFADLFTSQGYQDPGFEEWPMCGYGLLSEAGPASAGGGA